MNNSEYLFAKFSFLRGISKILDLGATGKVFNYSKSEQEADYKALMSDWNMTGNDMREAMDGYKKQFKKELESDI